jgi:hypothetical protein
VKEVENNKIKNPLKGDVPEIRNPAKTKNKGNLPYLQARRKLRKDLFRR